MPAEHTVTITPSTKASQPPAQPRYIPTTPASFTSPIPTPTVSAPARNITNRPTPPAAAHPIGAHPRPAPATARAISAAAMGYDGSTSAFGSRWVRQSIPASPDPTAARYTTAGPDHHIRLSPLSAQRGKQRPTLGDLRIVLLPLLETGVRGHLVGQRRQCDRHLPQLHHHHPFACTVHGVHRWRSSVAVVAVQRLGRLREVSLFLRQCVAEAARIVRIRAQIRHDFLQFFAGDSHLPLNLLEPPAPAHRLGE